MQIPYKHTENIKLNQYLKSPEARQIDARRIALLIIPATTGKSAWEQLAYSDILKSRYQRMKRQAKSNTRLTTDLPNRNGTRILLQSMATDASTFEYLTTARELAAEIRKQNPSTLLLQFAGFAHAEATRLLQAMMAAILASVCPMPRISGAITR